MSTPKLAAIAGALTLALVGLGVLDAVFTNGTLRLPFPPIVADNGVAKQQGPDVETVAREHGFVPAPTDEESVLGNVLQDPPSLHTSVLLINEDRAAFMGWMDSPDVKKLLVSIKESLHASFSPEVKDIIDETQSEPGKPPRDVLLFLDPAIHPERVLIVRVRQRLYEFHIREGYDEAVENLVDALTE